MSPLEIKYPWNDLKYLMKRLEVDLKEGRNYSPEEFEKAGKMIYYLCGPIDTAGRKEQNIETFKLAAHYLKRNFNFEIKSPIELGTIGQDYLVFIKRDIELLLKCDAVILLPGWPQSKGARGELNIAMYLNMKIYFFDIDAPVPFNDMNF